LNRDQEDTNQNTDWQDRVWILEVAGQAGLYIAFPVFLGLVVGYLLDRQLGTIILFAVLFSMAGFGGGVFLVYRWVNTTVKRRLAEMKKEE
jgi:F0F1-type ATP synthase assembly protein I